VTIFCVHDAGAAGGLIYETLHRPTVTQLSAKRVAISIAANAKWQASR
jgi:hypothetical protein